MTQDFETLGKWENPSDFRAAIILLRDQHNRVSLQFRDDFPQVGGRGLWGYFGGEIEAGETIVQAACRELDEETGLHLTPDDLCPFVRVLSTSSHNAQHYVFVAKAPVLQSDIRLQEGAGFAFVHAGQLAQFNMIPAVGQVVEHYFKMDCERFK